MTTHSTWVPAALKPSALRLGTLALVAGLAFPLAITTPTYAAAPLPTTGALQFAAAATVPVTAEDIAPTDAVYEGWHQGARNGDVFGQFDVTADGVALLGRSQVIKGYADNAEDVGVRNATLGTVIPEASFTVTAGAPVFQIPMFFTSGGGTAISFTTLRPVAASTPGVNALSLDDEWIATRAVAGIPANTPAPLRDIVGGMDRYKVIAFGVYNQAGVSAVSSITWDGTTYQFEQTASELAEVGNADILPFQTGQGYPSLLSTYAGWHQGGYRADTPGAEDAYRVTEAGLELRGTDTVRPQVINGYADNSDDLSTGSNAVLPFAVRKASLTVVSGVVYWQLPVFYDNAGTTKFTTLRSASPIGEGIHDIELTDQWTVSSNVSDTILNGEPAPLQDIISALGQYKVLAFGVYAPEGPAVVRSITWDGRQYDFTQAPPTPEPVRENDIRPDAGEYPGWHQGGDPGTPAVTGQGLELSGRSQVINGYQDNEQVLGNRNVDLVAALRSASYTVTTVGPDSSVPVFQIPLYARIDTGDGNVNGFTTLRPASSVSGLNTFSLEQKWISSRTVGTWTANEEKPLKDLLKDLRDYKVLAFGVYNGIGTATVSDITWDGTRYTFANTAPTATPVSAVTKGGTTPVAGQPVTITLGGSDVDGNPLTYEVVGVNGGNATISGNQLTFRPAAGASGVKTFTYTVDDGRGGKSEAPVTITVAANRAPAVTAAARTIQVGKAVAIALAASDPDGDAVSYSTGAPSPAKGTVNQTGSRLVYTADASFVGRVTLPVAVTDGRGGTGRANVTYTVVKGTSSISGLAAVGTPRSTIAPKFKVTVSTSAGRVNSGIVTLSEGGRIGSGRVNAAGEVTITTSKLSKGKHTIRATFGGSTTTGTSTRAITITVR